MSDISPQVAGISRLLREQCWLLEELAGFLCEQRKALESNDRSQLELSTEHMKNLNRLLLNVDHKRSRKIDLLAAQLGQDPAELTLGRMAKLCSGPESPELLAIGSRLGALLDEITELRYSTRLLLEKNRRHATDGLSWLRKFRPGSGTYDRGAKISNGQSSSQLLDRTA